MYVFRMYLVGAMRGIPNGSLSAAGTEIEGVGCVSVLEGSLV